MESTRRSSTLNVAMFPWFAIGHIIPYLRLSNKLAERGHRVTFLLPTKPMTMLSHLNLHPSLITFVPLVVPHVDGLPIGAETMSDVPLSLASLIMTAMNRMRNHVEDILNNLNLNLVFFDFAYWIPAITRRLGIKSIHLCCGRASSMAYSINLERKLVMGHKFTEVDLIRPPFGFPSSLLQLQPHEARTLVTISSREFVNGMSIHEVLITSLRECDAMSFGTCKEIDGPYCDYIKNQYGKPVLLTGPVLPLLPTNCPLEDRWAKWLSSFGTGSVLYCAFGSEVILEKDQFRELILGLELTGLPFLAAMKPPKGARTVEEALPDGYVEGLKGRGVIYGGWVQQPLILGHPSVGCFVNHCGFGSLWEGLANDAQMVLVPQIGEQVISARFMTRELKVAVEVEKREEDGWFNKESVCKAVKMVMEEQSEVGKQVRANHAKWRSFLLSDGLESSYIDSFMQNLQHLLYGG